ncbi:MAG: alpha/beta hydrolase [Jaaginema sp. PMC 1079.18]|nr:alpha/beta hydrolase [Jaaginema sp. PMC 1080.18]MEC4851030.1 alpha/beta hydrolase [Jaaginema sp. PMC 1079.18]MEC4865832.1 alpha/beta hydrolase [Jaaginema sp. PMC 1078.18]
MKNPRRWRQVLIGDFTWKRLGRSLLFVYTTIALYLYFFSDRLIFLPQPSSYQNSADLLYLNTPDNQKIAATYRFNPDATYTLLYTHGNAEDLGDIEPVLNLLYDAGFSIFAYDYRGYGLSEGHPSEANAYEDIETAYRYLTRELKISPDRIIAFGRSVGGGSAVDLAVRFPVAGLILESAFTQAFRVVIPFPVFPFDKFRNQAKLKQIQVPVLIIHGTEDEIIPFTHGRALWETANPPKSYFWVENANHNDVPWVDSETYVKQLQEFARSLSP